MHEELAAANQRLAEYATQSEELATVKERNRLARELHDSLGHYLTIIHVQLQAAASQVDLDAARAKQALAKAARLTHEGLEDVRRSVAALRASPMAGKPLAESIAALVDELSATGTRATLALSGTPYPLALPAELTLYRAAQEALTNVRKHARATAAEVTLEYAAAHVRLTVKDDGAGQPAAVVPGFGLMGLRERARLVDGDLVVERGRGFSVSLRIPTNPRPDRTPEHSVIDLSARRK
jgi:signal transduction histidine kinase